MNLQMYTKSRKKHLPKDLALLDLA